MTADFAAIAIALYAGHHAGDYWVQTDHQARTKKDSARSCVMHCLTLVMTQAACLLMLLPLGVRFAWFPTLGGLVVSGVTHYIADRRTPLVKLAALFPGKTNFLKLGAPRGGHYDDNPQLATGAWALDQSWHIFFGVFVAALVVAL
jgi:hypothetical protein